MMDSEERVILKDLYTNDNGLDLYWFHSYRGLSVAQIYKAVQYLKNKKFIIQNENNIRIDRRKRKTILKSYADLFYNVSENWKNGVDFSEKISKNIPNELKGFR